MMDRDFCPGCYVYRAPLEVDGLFWEEFKAGGEYALEKQGFHVPKQTLKRNWPGVLYPFFVINEGKYIDYEPEIVGLPLEITPEMMKGTPAETPEEFIEITQDGLAHRIQNYRNHIKTYSNLREPEFTDFEKRVLGWNTTHGFLVPSKMRGTHSPVLHPEKGIFECRREYLFHVPEGIYQVVEEEADKFNSLGSKGVGYWAGIILSLGWEPNSNRCIWGFRKDMTTEFSKKFPKRFVDAMNYLTINLEAMLSE